jgi:hypothetical protein
MLQKMPLAREVGNRFTIESDISHVIEVLFKNGRTEKTKSKKSQVIEVLLKNRSDGQNKIRKMKINKKMKYDNNKSTKQQLSKQKHKTTIQKTQIAVKKYFNTKST